MKIEVKDFNLKDTILSGACFRVTEESDGSFTNILSDRVINIKQVNNNLIINSNNNENLKEIILEYFDLKRDYNFINKQLINNDNKMKEIINKCKGYKILNQEPFEMCISYIISQNNNVKRISNSINLLCKKYGRKIEFEGVDGGHSEFINNNVFLVKNALVISDYDTNCGSDVVIPKTINNKMVYNIRQEAFKNKQLTSVIFPETLIKIDYLAFKYNDITAVKIPDSVIYLSGGAFDNNVSITKNSNLKCAVVYL